MCVRSGFYNSPPRSIEVHLLKFEKWNDGATEEIDELPSRKVDASLPFYSFQWDVAYCLSMAPHKLRLWKLLRVSMRSVFNMISYNHQGDEGRFARVHNGYGLIEDSLKSAKMADLLAPGESSMNLLIEKRNVNDRWVWSGEDYKAQPSPQPGHVSGERVSLPSPPHQTFDDSDEDLKKAIEMSLKTAQVCFLPSITNSFKFNRKKPKVKKKMRMKRLQKKIQKFRP